MKIIPLAVTALLIAGCASDKAGQDLYTSSEVGVAKRILPCTVVSARPVMIKAEKAGDKGEAFGFIGGAILSSDNNNSGFVRYIGALLGGAAGRALSDTVSERAGVEYTVLLASGEERQLIQDTEEGEVFMAQGDACRLQVSGDFNRVTPAADYPDAVKKPETTQFAE